MDELKPCPFCGGEAEMLTAESMNGGYLFGIMCNDCRSRGDVYDTEAEAIEAWNTRAERTCHFIENYGEGCWSKEHRDGKCSICGEEMKGRYNYCPNCGAKVVRK